ncbi:MAG: methylated-DNA--[protein]-cysteine S-methyltransferase [Mycobacteriales bacterium]
MTLTATTVDTPLGPFTLLGDDDGVHAAGFHASVEELRARLPLARHDAPVEAGDHPAAKAVAAYFDGDTTALDTVPVAAEGSPFQREAWAALRRIPAGETLTYTELAAEAGRPEAVRAAGSACGRNPVALIVPCHRVVRTDGGLGGYAWGLDVKRELLAHERA